MSSDGSWQVDSGTGSASIDGNYDWSCNADGQYTRGMNYYAPVTGTVHEDSHDNYSYSFTTTSELNVSDNTWQSSSGSGSTSDENGCTYTYGASGHCDGGPDPNDPMYVAPETDSLESGEKDFSYSHHDHWALSGAGWVNNSGSDSFTQSTSESLSVSSHFDPGDGLYIEDNSANRHTDLLMTGSSEWSLGQASTSSSHTVGNGDGSDSMLHAFYSPTYTGGYTNDVWDSYHYDSDGPAAENLGEGGSELDSWGTYSDVGQSSSSYSSGIASPGFLQHGDRLGWLRQSLPPEAPTTSTSTDQLPLNASQAIAGGCSFDAVSFGTWADAPEISQYHPIVGELPTPSDPESLVAGLSTEDTTFAETPRAESIPDMNDSLLADGIDGTEQSTATLTLNAAAVDAVFAEEGNADSLTDAVVLTESDVSDPVLTLLSVQIEEDVQGNRWRVFNFRAADGSTITSEDELSPSSTPGRQPVALKYIFTDSQAANNFDEKQLRALELAAYAVDMADICAALKAQQQNNRSRDTGAIPDLKGKLHSSYAVKEKNAKLQVSIDALQNNIQKLKDEFIREGLDKVSVTRMFSDHTYGGTGWNALCSLANAYKLAKGHYDTGIEGCTHEIVDAYFTVQGAWAIGKMTAGLVGRAIARASGEAASELAALEMKQATEAIAKSGRAAATRGTARSGETVVSAADEIVRAQLGVVQAGPVGLPNDLLAFASKISPKAGFTDVLIHAAPDAFYVLRNGSWVKLTHRDLAGFLKSRGVTGNVRLIACEAGAGRLAQDLANKLGVTVEAATTKVGIETSTGQLLLEPGGRWIDFSPGVQP